MRPVDRRRPAGFQCLAGSRSGRASDASKRQIKGLGSDQPREQDLFGAESEAAGGPEARGQARAGQCDLNDSNGPVAVRAGPGHHYPGPGPTRTG